MRDIQTSFIEQANKSELRDFQEVLQKARLQDSFEIECARRT